MATLGLPRAASSLEELNKYLLPEFAPNYDALVKTSEPDRSLLWMACLFQLVKGHDLEQVAFWKLYQAQFHPHHDKQPLATASALISAAEGFARPDKIEAGDGQAALYVLKDLKVKSAEDRLLAMADLRMVDGRLQAAGKATSIASPSPSVKPTPVASPFPSVNPPIDESPVPPRKRPRSDGPEAPTEPPTTPATTPFASSSSSSGTNSSSSASASPILDGSTELLCPTDAERIGRFPEPHRTKIWLACIFSPDAQKGIGQEALSALYARQFDTLYSSCVKLQSPAEVVGTVPTVFPDAKIILRPALAQNGSAFVQGIRIRSPFFHSKALANLLDFTTLRAEPEAALPPSGQAAVQQLAAHMGAMIKEMEIIKHQSFQESIWDWARRLNAAATTPKSPLYALTMLRPPVDHPHQTPYFPKTVADADALTADQLTWLLKFYGREAPQPHTTDNLRQAFFGFIGCPLQQ